MRPHPSDARLAMKVAAQAARSAARLEEVLADLVDAQGSLLPGHVAAAQRSEALGLCAHIRQCLHTVRTYAALEEPEEISTAMLDRHEGVTSG